MRVSDVRSFANYKTPSDDKQASDHQHTENIFTGFSSQLESLADSHVSPPSRVDSTDE